MFKANYVKDPCPLSLPKMLTVAHMQDVSATLKKRQGSLERLAQPNHAEYAADWVANNMYSSCEEWCCLAAWQRAVFASHLEQLSGVMWRVFLAALAPSFAALRSQLLFTAELCTSHGSLATTSAMIWNVGQSASFAKSRSLPVTRSGRPHTLGFAC